jgi:hypothetical protein
MCFFGVRGERKEEGDDFLEGEWEFAWRTINYVGYRSILHKM